jgi:multidrug efflux system membrane fusion protein
VPEDELPRVLEQQAKGQPNVEAYNRDGTIKLGVGLLTVIDNQINQTTATIKLKAVFPNPSRLLWPNEFIRARLFLTTVKGATTIPNVAVQRGPQGSFVYVVSQENVVSSRPVEVSLVQGETAIVAKGLSVGETIVIDGQSQLKPGAKVSPRTSDRRSPAASATASPASSAPRPASSAQPGVTP